jgi:nicotinamidase-related amidase
MTTSTSETTGTGLAAKSLPFLSWLSEWEAGLPALDLETYLQDNAIPADEVAIVSADLVEGFCYSGPLASPRIADVVQPSADLMRRAYDLGVRQFALVQEYHTHDAPEFDQFGPHCIRGTEEAGTVEQLASLPFAGLFTVIHKNSLHPALHTDLGRWLDERPTLSTFITVGDCTDLCLYQLVMHLKLNANAVNRRVNVIVPTNCVQTYDLPLDTARSIGAMPHDGDLLHSVFMYHMALNGAQVVRNIT